MEFHESYCVSKDGQISDTKKVKLEEPCFFDRIHVVLRDNLASLRVVLCRYKIDQGGRGDNDARCVHRYVSHASFKFLGEINYLTRGRIGSIHFFEVRFEFHRMLECHWKSLCTKRN